MIRLLVLICFGILALALSAPLGLWTCVPIVGLALVALAILDRHQQEQGR